MSDDPAGPDDVLSGLPRKRPQRSSARREAARAKAGKNGAAAKTRAAAAKPKPAPKPKPRAVKTPAPEAPQPVGRTDPSPAELAAAAVRATGELVELGGKVLRGILRNVPRP